MVRSDGRRLTPVATNGDPPDCESLPFLPNQRHNFRRARTRNFEYQLSVRACVRVCACVCVCVWCEYLSLSLSLSQVVSLLSTVANFSSIERKERRKNCCGTRFRARMKRETGRPGSCSVLSSSVSGPAIDCMVINWRFIIHRMIIDVYKCRYAQSV